jgi:uncharacterized OB-fold protein
MSNEETLSSRRTLSLRFNIPISRTKEFWAALKAGKLITTKCKSCGKVAFPPQADCPRCMSSEHEWVELGPDAVLVTFTNVQITPTSFVNSDPYIVGIGKVADDLNVLAWVEGASVEQLKPGDKLKLQARTSPEGSNYYVFVKT